MGSHSKQSCIEGSKGVGAVSWVQHMEGSSAVHGLAQQAVLRCRLERGWCVGMMLSSVKFLALHSKQSCVAGLEEVGASAWCC
jgi:hypothetical protein